MQPIIIDEADVCRFQANKIIVWLQQRGIIDLNALETQPFPDEERAQLAQLLGASVDRYLELDCVKAMKEHADEVHAKARAVIDKHNGKLPQLVEADDPTPVIEEIIAKNADKVVLVATKPAVLGWFVGQVMKAMAGKANPETVVDILKDKLGLVEAKPWWRV